MGETVREMTQTDLGEPAFSTSRERIREWSEEGQWLWRDPLTGRASPGFKPETKVTLGIVEAEDAA